MSLRLTVRALPTLLKVGFAEAVAYRAEMLVWVLATTMPLVMLALWSAVAEDAPVGRFGQAQFIAYFLSTFIVRQMTGSWASWQINFEVRQGTLSMRLLRPVHPLIAYTLENVAAMPMRVVVSLPVAIVLLIVLGKGALAHTAASWGIFVLALVGGWLLTVVANLIVGTLALFIESSVKVMDIYLAIYFVLSGYLIPVELFPPYIRAVADVLPFRYQIGFAVELMTGAYDDAVGTALGLLARQWLMAIGFVGVAAFVWSRGVRRFSAYGG
jgi:viologen exporter family transport system permease protein